MIFRFLIFVFLLVLVSIMILTSLPLIYSLYFGDNISLIQNNKTSWLSPVQLAATENGSIYLVGVDKYSIYFSSSSDNGTKFNNVILSNSSFASSPQIAATEKGNVYVVWVDKKNSTKGGDTNIAFRWSNDAGKSFSDIQELDKNPSVSSLYPQIAATEKGNVYVVWVDKKNSTSGNDTDITLRWSNDAGKSFSDIQELDKNPHVSSLSPQIAATEKGNVYVVWVDKKNINSNNNRIIINEASVQFLESKQKNSTRGGDTDITLKWSNDAGKSFDHSKLIKGKNKHSLTPQLAATEKGNVYVVWIDKEYSTSGIDNDVVLMWSNDTGQNFHEKKLSRSQEKLSLTPQIAATEKGNVYVVWVAKKNSASGGDSEIVLRWSEDGGENFNRKELSEGFYSPSIFPQIAATEDGNVYVVWEETNVKFKQIIIDYKPFYGETITINDNNNSKYPQLAATEKGNVYVAWTDKQNSTDVQNLLFFKRLSNFLFD